MRTHGFYTFMIVTATGAWLAAAGAYTAPQAASTALVPVAAHTVVAAQGSQLKNPVAADDASKAAGKEIYDQFCMECHGEAGKGDGPRGPYTTPAPPDLTDAEWTHGDTDGDIFTVIQKGVEGTDMASFAADIPEADTWNVVNYVRSLAAAK